MLNANLHRIEHKEESDTWDLNDPKRIPKTLPARIGDDDPRLGPCSAQVFAGEDLLFAERKALQQAQNRAWVKQVSDERAAVKAKEHAEMMAFASTTMGAAASAEEVLKETSGECV